MKLINQSKGKEVLFENVIHANTLATRSKGLLGRDHLENQECMWIEDCKWVHMFFMKFAIDVVFVNKDLKVKYVQKNLKPWRLSKFVFTADSVFECAVGTTNNIEIGDQLYVGN